MSQIRYRLDDLLKKHGVSAYEVARETKLRVESVRMIRHNRLQRLNVDLLRALCDYFYALDPEFRLEDLIVYEPNTPAETPPADAGS